MKSIAPLIILIAGIVLLAGGINAGDSMELEISAALH